MKLQEGLKCYEAAQIFRSRHDYDKAGKYMLAAAKRNVPEACWEMAAALSFCGGLGFDHDEEKAQYYFKRGALLGDQLCKMYARDMGYIEDDGTPITCTMARVMSWEMRPDDLVIPLTQEEEHIFKIQLTTSKSPERFYLLSKYWKQKGKKDLEKRWLIRAAQLGHASAQINLGGLCKEDGDVSFLVYANRQNNRLGAIWLLAREDLAVHATMFDIFKALTLVLRQNIVFRDCTVQDIVIDNKRNLPEDMILRIKCHLGAYLEELEQDEFMTSAEESCNDFYVECEKRNVSAIIAFFGCFKRKKVAYLSKDTITLIAVRMFDPVKWIK